MPRFIKCFILGMSKTIDIGNTLEIHRATNIKANNISQSWKNVGIVVKEKMDKDLHARITNRR